MGSYDRTFSAEPMNEAHSNRNARQSEGSNLLVVLFFWACAFSSRAKLRMRQTRAQIFLYQKSHSRPWKDGGSGKQPEAVDRQQ